MRLPRSDRREVWSLPTEKVAYWFFRLNGCLTIENFVVHPDFDYLERGGQRTEADILAVRFPYRQEDQTRPMADSAKLISKKPLLLITEVKPGDCALNGPWTDRERGNMQRVLRAVGLHDPSDVEEVAGELYDRYESLRPEADVRLCAVGRSADRLLRNRPKVLTFTWTEIFEFIFDRFTEYGQVKRDNKQWDIVGRRLFRLVEQSPTRDEFVETAVDRLIVPERERL